MMDGAMLPKSPPEPPLQWYPHPQSPFTRQFLICVCRNQHIDLQKSTWQPYEPKNQTPPPATVPRSSKAPTSPSEKSTSPPSAPKPNINPPHPPPTNPKQSAQQATPPSTSPNQNP